MADRKSLIAPLTFAASVVATLPAPQAHAAPNGAPKVLRVVSHDEAAPIFECGRDRLNGLSTTSARLILVKIGAGH